MKSKKRKMARRSYEYLPTKVVRLAVQGDRMAQNQAILRYENYAKTCFRTIAETEYGLKMKDVPMEDLMQMVWIRFIKDIEKYFKV